MQWEVDNSKLIYGMSFLPVITSKDRYVRKALSAYVFL